MDAPQPCVQHAGVTLPTQNLALPAVYSKIKVIDRELQ